MSVFRVVTRIIPLNSSETAFEPASFDEIVDGNVGEIKVFNLTEPHSGMKYRIERIEYVQNAGPGESVDSINKGFAEKMKSLPGFVKLTTDDVPVNPYDKSFQLTLPKVLYGKTSDESGPKNSDSFKISVVKNFNFKKGKSKPKKSPKSLSPSDVSKETKILDDSKLKNSKYLTESKALFKPKYPTYLNKKLKNSVWRNKKFSNNLTKKKLSKSPNEFPDNHLLNLADSQNDKCPTANYVEATKDIDVRKTLDVRISPKQHEQTVEGLGSTDSDDIENRNGIISDEHEEKVDDSMDAESGELVISVPELNDESDDGSLISPTCLKTTTVPTKINNNCSSEDSSQGDSASNSDGSKVSIGKTVFNIADGHRAYKLLVALKKYFVKGECLICGFMSDKKDFNGVEHMESHTLSNSFASSYKCSCCDEKFSSPDNLYKHALAREKSYKYRCSVCPLPFKRKQYLMRHIAKCH